MKKHKLKGLQVTLTLLGLHLSSKVSRSQRKRDKEKDHKIQLTGALKLLTTKKTIMEGKIKGKRYGV